VNIRLRLLAEWAVVALFSSFAIIMALQWRGTAAFDNLVYDQLSSLGRPTADDDILLVSIDDPSLAELGRWPWPRRTHAELIEKLETGQPRSILLDILLSEPGSPDDDAALAKAMAGPAPVYLPVHFVTPGSNGRAFDTVLPTPQLAANASGLGQVNVEFDSDGRVRRIALCFQPEAGEKKWPHIVEVVARAGAKPTDTFARLGNCSQTLLIPYAKRGSFAEISYSEALKGGVPGDLIKGRDIIVGATAAGSGDSYPVPFSDGGLLSGAEIMANILAALKRDNFIRPVSDWLVILLSIIPSLFLLLGFLRLRPRNALLVSLGAVAAILLASSAALSVRYWFPPGAALIGIFLVYPLWGWRRLQAMSDFMGAELGELESEGEVIPVLLQRPVADDLVGRQSERLAGAIDHMRDLRRFVADTLEHMPDPLMVTDLDGGISLTNELLDGRLGRDVTGAKIDQVLDEIVHPQFRRQVDSYLKAATKDDNAIDPDAESHFVRFDSERDRTFVLRTAAIRSDADTLRGHIHYFTDITDLARAESDREVALQLLSHDMRAPQSAIIALLPDLANKPAGERIERHARRTMQLAQDFVDIARMGESAFEGTDILFADLVRDVADSMWPLAREKGIHINVQDNSEQAFVFAEPDSLSRALSNLLDNAIKFSPKDGTITAILNRSQVGEMPSISVSIEDEGDGIDPEIAPRLFERFASNRSDSARVKGIGLGLAFVRAVAEKHQGHVSAENRNEGGARFILSLPEAPDLQEIE
jgi:CHASE2 domain-containing sensor protein/signal transduction histidine kinase